MGKPNKPRRSPGRVHDMQDEGEGSKKSEPQYRVYQRDWTPTVETSGEPQYPGQVPIGGWQDEGDLLNPPPEKLSGVPLISKRDILGLVAAVVIVYALLTTALLFAK